MNLLYVYFEMMYLYTKNNTKINEKLMLKVCSLIVLNKPGVIEIGEKDCQFYNVWGNDKTP